MKYSYKLSDAVHLLNHLHVYQNGDLSSKAIANSIESNPGVVRQLMSDLRIAGSIVTRKGAAEPRLTKKPREINLFDIYQAVNMDHDLLHVDSKTNLKCIVGGNIQASLEKYYDQIQAAAFNEMKQILLADVIDDILQRQSTKLDLLKQQT